MPRTSATGLIGAYPRMRGGTSTALRTIQWCRGLSPHARGNRKLKNRMDRPHGPIPACAGEPQNRGRDRGRKRAYPRMRGGTPFLRSTGAGSGGLSPHARGNQGCLPVVLGIAGPIPACAGEPIGFRPLTRIAAAYPRMRGGTCSRSAAVSALLGLSPHARGNRTGIVWAGNGDGPIPACAGEPKGPKRRGPQAWAYPRMRGGTRQRYRPKRTPWGLSPHARGNLLAASACQLRQGPIPACAGEPKGRQKRHSDAWAYPRMRGGTFALAFVEFLLLGLSPHARGNH